MYVLKLRQVEDPDEQLMAVAHSENLQPLVEWFQARIAQEVRVVVDGNGTKIACRLTKDLVDYKFPTGAKEDEGIHELNADVLLTERVREYMVQERARIDASIEHIKNNTIKVN